ncbi:branched-chain amino acid ABC transporter permease [Bradyrhizobium erythrophlei]|jgi:branched-chain amino acid transport system permease protein|uniref:Amino acid/amide ABC transporter membrane protein 1, HAAT family n=1 Tax=Bradyrhizobium erythrophlei TaxID=1437360 RepID=A0A1M5SDF0_9BRAD|nr:branched-chain amino acid ABC transporter permease [Bradyrhizobium erythrophlei]SHH35953.1 amino acid/amide ABC transporter membrane protein 1, HAAT family [Bradyrhizobium erythrophlei]
MLAQQVVNGLLLGGIYALVALAFSLTIGILNFLNFSIPALFMLGGIVSCAMLAKGYSIAVSIAVALAVTGGVSLVIERFTFRWLKNSDSHIPLVSSLGFLVLFENLVVIYFGSDAVGYPSPFGGASIRIVSVLISLPQLASFAISLLLIVACYLIVTRTKLGRGLRSIAESPTISEMLGVDVGRTVSGMYLISGLLAGVGGALFGISYLQVSWDMGSEVALKGISAMVLGGMGNIWGALLGALIIAVVEVLTISYVSSEAVNIVVYGVLLALILLVPNGLLGDRAILVERM